MAHRLCLRPGGTPRMADEKSLKDVTVWSGHREMSLEDVAVIQPGLGRIMADIGNRAWKVYSAATAKNGPLAPFLRGVRMPVGPLAIPIRIALVGRPGGGGGAAGAPAEAVPAPAAPASPVPAPTAEPARSPRRAVVHAPARTPAATTPAAAPSDGVADRGGGGGGNSDGAGGGDGSGGDGSGGARVAYGANPLPPYPY